MIDIPRHYRSAQPPAGFTLVELVIVILLIGILGAVGVTMISDTFETTRMVEAHQGSQAQARTSVERIEREVREIRFVEGAGYAITVPATLPGTLALVPGNGSFSFVHGSTGATMTLAGSGGSLTLNGNTLVQHVTNATLTLRDVAGVNNPAPTLATVKFIQLDLTLKDPMAPEVTQRTRIALRNGS